jgi:hypothetical protein
LRLCFPLNGLLHLDFSFIKAQSMAAMVNTVSPTGIFLPSEILEQLIAAGVLISSNGSTTTSSLDATYSLEMQSSLAMAAQPNTVQTLVDQQVTKNIGALVTNTVTNTAPKTVQTLVEQQVVENIGALVTNDTLEQKVATGVTAPKIDALAVVKANT